MSVRVEVLKRVRERILERIQIAQEAELQRKDRHKSAIRLVEESKKHWLKAKEELQDLKNELMEIESIIEKG